MPDFVSMISHDARYTASNESAVVDRNLHATGCGELFLKKTMMQWRSSSLEGWEHQGRKIAICNRTFTTGNWSQLSFTLLRCWMSLEMIIMFHLSSIRWKRQISAIYLHIWSIQIRPNPQKLSQHLGLYNRFIHHQTTLFINRWIERVWYV